MIKNANEIKPEIDAKLLKSGTGQVLVLPNWFVEQWNMVPNKRYKILIQEEVPEAKGLKTGAKTSRGMAVNIGLVRGSPPFSSYIGNYYKEHVTSTD